jgi:hypothetical protein
MSGGPQQNALYPGRIVHGTVVEHHSWGINLKLEEVDVYGTVDLRFLDDDPIWWNEDRYPRIGVRLTAAVQGTMPNGQLRLTIRKSDLDRIIKSG